MSFKYDKFPIPQKGTGKFGVLKARTGISNLYLDGKISVNKRIERYSNEGNLLAEIFVVTSLDNTKECIELTVKILLDKFENYLRLNLNRSVSNEGIMEYFLDGSFYFRGVGEYIHSDIYSEIRSKITKICDLDFDYGCSNYFLVINDLFGLLHTCKNEGINEFVKHWETILALGHEGKPMGLILKNNTINNNKAENCECKDEQ